jgi:cyclophilin family peptidyl-prolyl cis-trans isomerase
MIKKLALLTCAASLAAFPLAAQEPAKPEYPSPPEIVAKAKADEWVAIAPSDLMVMDLAPLGNKPRRVVIQLMPAPFSQGWVGNMRKLAAAKFWDGTSVNRVQDNYVVQWGDATEKKALPNTLKAVAESEYVTAFKIGMTNQAWGVGGKREAVMELLPRPPMGDNIPHFEDPYTRSFSFIKGFPIAMTSVSDYVRQGSAPVSLKLMNFPKELWPTHCYAMVGVGRNLSPDTGTGAELYTVIGHAPRHLDRNIALVGRVIEGIEHLSSLPRGTGALGFYETEAERVPILSVRIGKDAAELPAYEHLSTESASFAAYADARANRRDPFFILPAGGADICNIPVPVRRKAQ